MDTVDLILGTAGHVDHGKTTLIRALTGVDTDRLPEERRRGISIELGFATWNLPPYRFGVVDVPGHAKFVRQMLVGAAGMDLALLVVAADDSVNAQTLEHLAILKTLAVRAGVIAITKSSLVSPERLQQVATEVRSSVAHSFLESAPLVFVDSLENRGLVELADAVCMQARQIAPRVAERVSHPFRMPIDRVFAVAGHGTVVTGSVVTGRIGLGDELELVPGCQSVRVRSLQRHGQSVSEVSAGMRAAINLVGVKHETLGRGDELVSPGTGIVSRHILATLHRLSDDMTWPRRFSARLHLGASERSVVVHVLKGWKSQAASEEVVRLDIDVPLAAAWGQPFVIRRASPQITIAGGRVLMVQAPVRLPEAPGEPGNGKLQSDSLATRLEESLRIHGGCGGDLRARGIAVGIPSSRSLIQDLEQIGRVLQRNGRYWHCETVESVLKRIEVRLERCHRIEPMAYRFPAVRWWPSRIHKGDDALVEAAIIQGVERGRLHGSLSEGIGLVSCDIRLAPGAERVLDEIVQELMRAGAQPPRLSSIRDTRKKYRDSFDSLIEEAIRRGQLIRLDAEHCLHHDVWKGIVRAVVEMLDRESMVTVAQVRDLLGVTRRHAVPICELLDQHQITIRDGDLRRRADGQAK